MMMGETPTNEGADASPDFTLVQMTAMFQAFQNAQRQNTIPRRQTLLLEFLKLDLAKFSSSTDPMVT